MTAAAVRGSSARQAKLLTLLVTSLAATLLAERTTAAAPVAAVSHASRWHSTDDTAEKNLEATDSDRISVGNKRYMRFGRALLDEDLPYAARGEGHQDIKRYMRFGRANFDDGNKEVLSEQQKRYMRFGRVAGTDQQLFNGDGAAASVAYKRYMRFGRNYQQSASLVTPGDEDELIFDSPLGNFDHLSSNQRQQKDDLKIAEGDDNQKLEILKRYMRFGRRALSSGGRSLNNGVAQERDNYAPSMDEKRYMRFGRASSGGQENDGKRYEDKNEEEKRYMRFG